MDLFAPCRSCLQCLPFFHVSPPSTPRLAAAAPSSSPHSLDASQATSTDPSQSSENLPCPNATPTVQEQDLCLPIKAEEEPQAPKFDKDEALESFEAQYSTPIEAAPVSGIFIAPPVSSPGSGASLPQEPEDNKTTTLPELPLHVPFINDITFPASGFMPLQSPITPAPFGAGYQYPPHDQIYQGQHLGHAHLHHGHENSQHSHEHSLLGHDSAQHEHKAPRPPLDDSQVIDELHKDGSHHGSHHDSHHHSHDSSIVDDTENAVTGHVSLDDDRHDKIDDISPTLPLEATQSTPDLDLAVKFGGESSEVSHTNGAPAVLETYHSEPVGLSGDPHDDDNEAQNEVFGISGSHPGGRRRRRDHFRDQFKGFKQQVKQGGLHLKEEGSKHMLTIIDNMNKQAQQIEQSGSVFAVPRVKNN